MYLSRQQSLAGRGGKGVGWKLVELDVLVEYLDELSEGLWEKTASLFIAMWECT